MCAVTKLIDLFPKRSILNGLKIYHIVLVIFENKMVLAVCVVFIAQFFRLQYLIILRVSSVYVCVYVCV